MRLRFFWIVIAAVSVLVLITVIFLIFNRPKSNVSNPAGNKTVVIANYSNSDATVSYTAEGITNGDEMHRAIKITVSKDIRKLEIIEGYQGKILESDIFNNNPDAFKAFLAGLQNRGYLISRKSSVTDVTGQCPLGDKFFFNTYGISNAPGFLWTTGCSVSPGTFGGNLTSIQRLFQLQIPRYSTLTADVDI
jgi:hypothetical protein